MPVFAQHTEGFLGSIGEPLGSDDGEISSLEVDDSSILS